MPAPHSETVRLEAFSDAVFAIILTIMVLELKAPHEATIEGLKPLVPVFFSYVMSYLYIAIYWNNHHHLLHATEKISGRIMWANMLLLFWLSLIPFCTSWIGENTVNAALPAVVYGCVLLLAGLSYSALQHKIIVMEGPQSALAKAVGRDIKGKISLGLYVVGVAAAFVHPWFSYGIFLLVALLWFVPDRRLKVLFEHADEMIP